VPEPRTHYQVSFTARQAVALFAIFLAALAGAYFLGIATGMAGRPRPETEGVAGQEPAPTIAPREAAAPASPASAPVSVASPEAHTSAPAVAAREPAKEGKIQFFEDRPEEPAKAPPSPKPAAAESASASGAFWVQILSTRSEAEAKSRSTRLTSHGFHAAVSKAPAGKGQALYRVRVGPYASREEAAKAAEAIAGKEKLSTWIVPPGE
jgi:DedD protein